MKDDRETRAASHPQAVLATWLLAALSPWALVSLAGAAGGTASAGIAGTAPLALPAGLEAGRFAADLRSCRNAAGGRPAHRALLDPRHPRIASCLRTRGWWPDGTPSLERLLQRS